MVKTRNNKNSRKQTRKQRRGGYTTKANAYLTPGYGELLEINKNPDDERSLDIFNFIIQRTRNKQMAANPLLYYSKLRDTVPDEKKQKKEFMDFILSLPDYTVPMPNDYVPTSFQHREFLLQKLVDKRIKLYDALVAQEKMKMGIPNVKPATPQAKPVAPLVKPVPAKKKGFFGF